MRTGWNLALRAGLVLLAAAACVAQEEESPYFTDDLEAAMEGAKKDGRLVVCEVYTPG